ncbi:MAG: hypothetical protein HGA90_04280 [Alphaproteobacteria bacterium]|nr:hypothetical protein [Alphaproteobacteria bacterium]
MSLPRAVVTTLVDLVENKLAVMQIGNREDLREMMILQHCLTELQSANGAESDELKSYDSIPHRGRHRKFDNLVEDMSRQRA